MLIFNYIWFVSDWHKYAAKIMSKALFTLNFLSELMNNMTKCMISVVNNGLLPEKWHESGQNRFFEKNPSFF